MAPEVVVDFQRFFIKVGAKKYLLKMKYVLQALVRSLEKTPIQRSNVQKVEWDPYPLANVEKTPKLTQDYLWAASRHSLPGYADALMIYRRSANSSDQATS